MVSAVILAILHRSDSLLGFLRWSCRPRAESLQLVAPGPWGRAVHADPRLFVPLCLLHVAVRSSQHEHGILGCVRGAWAPSIAWGLVPCTYIQPGEGRAAISCCFSFFFFSVKAPIVHLVPLSHGSLDRFIYVLFGEICLLLVLQ